MRQASRIAPAHTSIDVLYTRLDTGGTRFDARRWHRRREAADGRAGAAGKAAGPRAVQRQWGSGTGLVPVS